MTERETVPVTILEIGSYEWPDTLDGLLDKISDAREAAPPEYHDSIQIECDTDEYSATVSFYYERPETDKEMAARQAIERRYAVEGEARQRSQYERLKKKFSDE